MTKNTKYLLIAGALILLYMSKKKRSATSGITPGAEPSPPYTQGPGVVFSGGPATVGVGPF